MSTPKKAASAILAKYQKRVVLLKAAGSQHKEIQPLTTADVLLIRAIMHPTNKRTSKDLTRRLVNYLCEKEITTAADIYNELVCSDNPILHRLRKFREMGLIRRESKYYYLPTVRMYEMKEKYLERVCG